MTWLPDGRATVHPLVLTDPPAGPDGSTPLGDPTLQPDSTRTLQVFQLRPDTLTGFVAWTGGTELLLNGGPVVLLTGNQPAAQRLVGLGDFAVRDGDRTLAEPAAGFWQRYQPVEE